MKKTALLIMTALLAVSAWAQNNVYNDANAEKRSVSGFHAISISGGIDLQLTQGNEEAVAVSASKTEYRDKIKTVVENGVLKIYYDNENLRNWSLSWNGNSKKLKAYVSVKNIDGLKASGGSDVIINGTLNSSKLQLGLSGGSDFKGSVNITELNSDLSGGSDLDISGRATSITIEASGGSDVKGYELTVDNCTASCSGGSDITITVNKELTASASGGSDIYYRGNATVKKKSSSGGSSVVKRG